MNKYIKLLGIITLALIIMVFVKAGMDSDKPFISRGSDEVETLYINEVDVTDDGRTHAYTFKINDDSIQNKHIIFLAKGKKVEVSLDNEILYSYNLQGDNIFGDIGGGWISILLEKEYSGKDINILVDSNQAFESEDITFYFGYEEEIYYQQRKLYVGEVYTSMLIFLVGVLILIFYLLVFRKNNNSLKLIYLSLSAISLGLCVGFKYYHQCYMSRDILITHVISQISFMLLHIFFVLYIYKIITQNRKWILALVYMNFTVLIVRLSLLLLRVATIDDTNIISYVVFVGGILIIIGVLANECKNNQLETETRAESFAVIFMLVVILVDYVIFRGNENSVDLIIQVTFFAYIMILAITSCYSVYRKMTVMKNNGVYKKLEFHDEMTGLKNRAALDRKIKDIEEEIELNGNVLIAIFVFDLNSLNKVNDKYGQIRGDRYIIKFSEIIRKVFEVEGHSFRCDDDKFVVIKKDKGEIDIEIMINNFNSEMKIYKNDKEYSWLSVAMGYALYDRKWDKTVNDTLLRADKLMYQNKKYKKKLV